MTRIIGIDPGSRVTGYGIIDTDGQNIQLVEAGCIRLAPKEIPLRLKHLHREISQICRQFRPHSAAVEKIFYARNVRTALVLGQVRGVILLTLASRSCEIFEYSALQVKNSITGYGRAEKHQVRKMIEAMVQVNFEKIPYDLTDALGLAITHAHVSGFQSKLVVP